MSEITAIPYIIDKDGNKSTTLAKNVVYLHTTDENGNDIDCGGIDLKNRRLLDSQKGVSRQKLRELARDYFSEIMNEELPAPTVTEPAPIQKLTLTDLSTVRPGENLLKYKSDSWEKGSQGEMKTALILTGMKTLHSVMIRSRHDIDHIVFTTKGIFAINTKVSSSTVTVEGGSLRQGGISLDWMTDADSDARILSTYLSQMLCGTAFINAKPVIAVWGEIDAKEPGTVPVVKAASLRDWIESQPEMYTSELVDYLFGIAKYKENWRLQA